MTVHRNSNIHPTSAQAKPVSKMGIRQVSALPLLSMLWWWHASLIFPQGGSVVSDLLPWYGGEVPLGFIWPSNHNDSHPMDLRANVGVFPVPKYMHSSYTFKIWGNNSRGGSLDESGPLWVKPQLGFRSISYLITVASTLTDGSEAHFAFWFFKFNWLIN